MVCLFDAGALRDTKSSIQQNHEATAAVTAPLVSVLQLHTEDSPHHPPGVKLKHCVP